MKTVTTPQAAHILGMSYRTLDNWVRTGLVTCTQVADGRGSRRGWTVDDVCRVAYLQSLRHNGVSTQQLNAMKEAGTLDHLRGQHLEAEKAHGDAYTFSDLVLMLKDKVVQITIQPKRKAIQDAFDALEAGLSPEPLTYDDEPSGIEIV